MTQPGLNIEESGSGVVWSTHRPLGSSSLGLPYRFLDISHKKELLRGLWVVRFWDLGRGSTSTEELCLETLGFGLGGVVSEVNP